MTDLEREILQQDELAIRNHLELILRAKENGASKADSSRDQCFFQLGTALLEKPSFHLQYRNKIF